MMVVGLTGGIGSGKSTVSTMLREAGVPVVCADELAKKAVEKGSPALEEIRRTFGDGVIDAQGRLDRAAMARLVFSDSSRRKKLESIIHPRVEEEKDRIVHQYSREGHPIVAVDVPLLFESGWESAFDLIIVVYVPREVQEKRLMYRNGISKEEALARLDAQMPIEEKKGRADRVIDNSGTVEETRRQVDRVLDDIRTVARTRNSRTHERKSRGTVLG